MAEHYGIDVVQVRRGRTVEWAVTQTMTPEDARAVAYALGTRDGAAEALLAAAERAESFEDSGWV